jgi:TatD DNase family protein
VIEFVDSHCHPFFSDLEADADGMMDRANKAGVTKLIAVGTSVDDSQKAIDFAKSHNHVWASVGVHPHEASRFMVDESAQAKLKELLNKSSICAVGEIGLDYYKNISPRDDQINMLRWQLDQTKNLGLPYIFHVRDAWEDFWQIFDKYDGITGVIHSFTSGTKQLNKALERGLYVGLNGIVTFTRDESQLTAAKAVPADRLLIETDAPFLTPAPFRGQVCEPKHVAVTADFLANLRGEKLDELAATTTANAIKIYGLAK